MTRHEQACVCTHTHTHTHTTHSAATNVASPSVPLRSSMRGRATFKTPTFDYTLKSMTNPERSPNMFSSVIIQE